MDCIHESAGDGAVSVERIDDPAAFEGLREAWNELLAASGADGLFLTWEWLHAWWRHLAGGRKLSLIAVRSAGRLIAIAPLARRPRSLTRLLPFPALEFLGTGTAGSDYLDLIVRRGCEQTALPALAEFLAAGDAMIELSHVRASGSLAADLAAQLGSRDWASSTSRVNVCPFIPLGGHSWASYLATLGSAQRYNFQRRLKNLSKQFDVRFEMARTDDERREALQALTDLHNSRWRERGGSESFATPALRSFYDEVSRSALERGWLRLFVLRLDGRPVAAMHAYRYGPTFSFYQAGFDPGLAKYSVGLVAMGLAIKSAIEEGAEEYDLLHGDEPYKYQWARESRELSRIELFSRSRRGRLCQRAVGLSRATRRTARRVLGDAIANSILRAGSGGASPVSQ